MYVSTPCCSIRTASGRQGLGARSPTFSALEPRPSCQGTLVTRRSKLAKVLGRNLPCGVGNGGSAVKGATERERDREKEREGKYKVRERVYMSQYGYELSVRVCQTAGVPIPFNRHRS